jgi:lipid II:glycine glycyltransferase (peptidoglycan interpeptide bridge formation enzyme)
MKTILNVNDIDLDKWESLVKISSVATWFQTREAFAFFDSLTFMDSFVMAVESCDVLKGLVVGYVQKDGGKLKQFFSKRAIILGGPLLADDITDEELRSLLKALKNSLKHKAIYIEARNFNNYSGWRNVFEDCGFEYEPHYNVQIETASLEAVNARLDRNRRRNIKKATENGLVIDEKPTEKELVAFYAMLDELFRTKVKSPLYPYEFFAKLRALPSSHFFMAKNAEGELLGGLVCVALEGRAVYAWATCGDDQNHRALSPSVMANYAGICHAAKNGYPRFDFMGAGKPDDGGYGVRDFKLKFGGELVEHGRFVHVCNPLLFNIGKLGLKILKRI